MHALELFPCSGGMAEGFRRAGIVFDVAIDFDADACDSYERNHGHRPEQMDVRDLLEDVRAAGDAASLFFGGPLRLIVADPPCTPWSRAGKRLGVHDERDMLGVTCELIRLLRPAAYLIGNVPGLDDSTQWHHVQAALAPLRRAGYCIADYTSLDAADYGVPQHRVRPFWFGHLAGPCIRWPLPTHGDPHAQRHALPGLALKPWVTCRQALEHLPLEHLGRPVHLRRDLRDVHPASEPEAPARVVPSSMPGNGGAVLVDRSRSWEDRHPGSNLDAPARTLRRDGGRAGRRESVLVRERDDGHPCATPDAPSPVVRGGGEGHAAPQLVLANSRHPPAPPAATIGAKDRGQGTVLAVERKPDPNHPADSPDAPARSVTAQAGCTNLLRWPWDRPSTSILRDPRIPPPGHHSTGSFLSPDEARGTKSWQRNHGPQGTRICDPGETASRVGAGSGQVKAWPWDRPSTTVDAGPTLAPYGRDGRAGEHQRHHPNAIVLSERAATILQGFPESWVFSGKTKKTRWSQLGQAMPPALAEAVARSVVEQLSLHSLAFGRAGFWF